jgi:hypothetical protein
MNSANIAPPVLLLAFNRPDTTARTLESIRAVQPGQLFFAVDGPRPERAGESERVAAVQALADSVDWECDLRTLFRERNLGLKTAVSEAISWFFAGVEQGIVLEDDCVADPSFFRFAGELLEKYRDDERVMAVSGNNFQFGKRADAYSYYFSRYNHVWGWASWRRAWRLYDHGMSRWPGLRERGWPEQYLRDPVAASYWADIFDETHAERNASWAYRWTFACWAHGGLTVLPAVNLVSNIGFGTASTHTFFRGRVAAMATQRMQFPLAHPPSVTRNEAADDATEKVLFSRAQPLLRRLKRVAKALGIRRGSLPW